MQHETNTRAGLREFDCRGEECVDSLAVGRHLRDLLSHSLVHQDPRLPGTGVRGSPARSAHRRYWLARTGRCCTGTAYGADEAGRLGVPVEEHVVPRDLHVVEDDHGVDLVHPVGERVVLGRSHAPEPGPADVLDVRIPHVGGKAGGVLQVGLAVPVTDGRLGEGLVGIRRRGFELRSAHHDSTVVLAHDAQQYVGILFLGPL